jgi:multicomponent Na+:H+ antiporter subunit E
LDRRHQLPMTATETQEKSSGRLDSAASWALRVAGFAALWLVLAGTKPASWIVGVPFILLASFAAARLSRQVGADPRPLGMLTFVPFFLWESVLGGIDVARRVLSPKLPIAPAILTYRTRLSDPAAQVAFINSISLLPGTLSADFRNGVLQVHALDGHTDVLGGLKRLEHRVAALFGQALRGEPESQLHWCDPHDSLRIAQRLAETNGADARSTPSAHQSADPIPDQSPDRSSDQPIDPA